MFIRETTILCCKETFLKINDDFPPEAAISATVY